jgi:hypothetical protein
MILKMKCKLKFIALGIPLVTLLIGCANDWTPSMPIGNRNYVPIVSLEGSELTAYYKDVVICQKQILIQYGEKYSSGFAIGDLRLCLINKGYVLLS